MKHYFIVVKVICLSLITSYVAWVNAQTQEELLSKTIPPAPNAAAMEKYINIPVSYYTGTPEITVPIWEAKSRDLSLPIYLSYHASGIKVEENASWVGLGWSLNAGGAITRQKNGLPDEHNYFKVNSLETIKNDLYNLYRGYLAVGHLLEHSEVQNELHIYPKPNYNFIQKHCDGEPDIFNFSIPGYSGKIVFAFNENGDYYAQSIPVQNIIINPILNTGENNFDKWEIIVEDGTKYVFEEKEYAYTTSIGTGPMDCYVSGWHLTKVISPANNSTITLTYDKIDLSYQQFTGLTKRKTIIYQMEGSNNPSPPTHYLETFKHKELYLKEIIANHTKIKFHKNLSREDLLSGGARLNSIEILNNFTNETIKSFELDQEYFNSNNNNLTGTQYEYLAKRLKLNSVYEISNGVIGKVSTFNYYENEVLPPKISSDIDYWGFYNNKIINDSFQFSDPNLQLTILPYPTIDFYYSNVHVIETGIDRTPEESGIFQQAWSLKQINYPTGGYTQFKYEPHTYGYQQNVPVVEQVYSENEKIDYINLQTLTENSCHDSYMVMGESTEDVITINENQEVRVSFSGIHVPVFTYPARAYWEITRYGETEILHNKLFEFVNDEDENETTVITDLAPGNYTVKLRICNVKYGAFNVTALEKTGELYTKTAGGIRIKEIISYDGKSDTNKKIFDYKDENSSVRSSGNLISVLPIFYKIEEEKFEKVGDIRIDYHKYATISAKPLNQSISSNLVGYGKVNVLNNLNEKNNGKTSYYYTTTADMGFRASSEIPFNPPIDNSLKRGLLTKMLDFNNNNQLIKKEQNKYQFVDLPMIIGFMSGFTAKSTPFEQTLNEIINNASIQNLEVTNITPVFYSIPIGWKFKEEITTTEYYYNDPNMDSIVNSSKYYYENPLRNLLTKLETTNSNNVTKIKKYNYTSDYSFKVCDALMSSCKQEMDDAEDIANGIYGSCMNNCYLILDNINWDTASEIMKAITLQQYYDCSSQCIIEKTQANDSTWDSYHNCVDQYEQSYNTCINNEKSNSSIDVQTIIDMQDKNIIAPIEELNYKKNGTNNEKLISATYTKFKKYGTYDIIKPNQVYKINNDIPLINFDETKIIKDGATNELFFNDEYSLELTIDKYDNYGNVLQYHKQDGRSVSFIWGYYNTFPIAKIENAEYDTIATILGTDLTLLNGTSLTESQILDKINLLRNQLPNAIITGYTYDPLIGITSTTDPNNLKTTYEYDDFGRLKLVRDHNGNILEKIEYHYAQ